MATSWKSCILWAAERASFGRCFVLKLWRLHCGGTFVGAVTPLVTSRVVLSLIIFCNLGLKCFKHFVSGMFETFARRNAGFIYISRRHPAHRHHCAAVAVVGRARHCRPVAFGAPPRLLLRRPHRSGGDM